jgi:hypothetical protein
MERDTARVAVQRGASLLDELAQAGWENQVDLDTLDTNHALLCVLGQLYGDYGAGCEAVLRHAITGRGDPVHYGFDSPGRQPAGCALLTEEWCQLLRDRRAHG